MYDDLNHDDPRDVAMKRHERRKIPPSKPHEAVISQGEYP